MVGGENVLTNNPATYLNRLTNPAAAASSDAKWNGTSAAAAARERYEWQ